MGCRTGFYLLTTNMGYGETLAMLKNAFADSLRMEEVPGALKNECGNYLEHDLAGAKRECAAYLALLETLGEKENG